MKVTLLTRDATRLDFPCTEAETVLEAAEAAGLYPAAMCRDGQCGQCGAQALSGHYTMRAHNKEALPTCEQAILLCSCLPQDDLTIALPYNNAQLSRHIIPTREVVIESINPAGASAVSLTLRLTPDARLGQSVEFLPGQYMEIGLPGTTLHRAYSLTNLPNWDGLLEFLIRLVPGGAFTGWLTQTAKRGDSLTVRGPLGRFAFDDSSPRARLLVGGGCGFAPLLSMLRQMAEFQDSTPVHLIYGINTVEDALPEAIFEELRAGIPQLHITLAVWHGSLPDNAVQGTAAECVAKCLAQSESKPDLYVCGPPKMLDSVIEAALAAGIAADHIFSERL